jgi:thiamine-phosphate pyrophosphorylase
MNAAQRRAKLRDARLYLCTGIRDDLPDFLDAVLRAGVDVVQLREKHAGRAALVDAARAFRAAADEHGALFVVNDDPELAVECDADGAHVGQDDLHPSKAREIVGGAMILGRSTHAEAEILRANGEPVDYLGVGPVNETPTKPGRAGTGLDLVAFARAHATVPFFVTGGMDATTIPAVAAAGAHGFVVVRAITESSDPAHAVRALRAAIGA